MFLTKYFAIFVYFSFSLCASLPERFYQSFESVDKECEIYDYDSGFGLNKFSGLRFHKVYKFQTFPFKYDTKLSVTHCNAGKIILQQELSLEGDQVWNKPFNITTNGQSLWFKFGKRKKHLPNKSSLFFPNSWIGGIYVCQRFSCDGNLQYPLIPIFADNYSRYWTSYSHGDSMKNWKIKKHVPYFVTLNDNKNIINSLFYNIKANDSYTQKPLLSRLKYYISSRERHVEGSQLTQGDFNESWDQEIDFGTPQELDKDMSTLQKYLDRSEKPNNFLKKVTNENIGKEFIQTNRAGLQRTLSMKKGQLNSLKKTNKR